MASSEERRDESVKEMVHRTKVIQFLGRSTPIILQNDNGPCPLLAICNVLLLKNNLNLSADIAEVSQEKLLSLVAERLIDSNSNVNNKDAGYVENQQQNIADAIDLLPRLATGIDVNIKFRRIDDFEFTPECAIFDLLDIPLYHGWIVDPQDHDTMCAIGSKSYNRLTGELVALETQNLEGQHKKGSEEDCIDFAAATTATLGVPSPCLSRGKSFDDSPHSVSDHLQFRQGDIEEEAQLLRVMKLSEDESSTLSGDAHRIDANGSFLSGSLEESVYLNKSEPLVRTVTLEGYIDGESQTPHLQEPSMSADCSSLSGNIGDLITFEPVANEAITSLPKTDQGIYTDDSTLDKLGRHAVCENIVDKTSVDVLEQEEIAPSDSSAFDCERNRNNSGSDEVQNLSTSKAVKHGEEDDRNGCEITECSNFSAQNADSDSSGNRKQEIDAPEAYMSNVDGNEPIYEGEECILDSGPKIYEDREPMYEGEVVLAEQVGKSSREAYDSSSIDELTPKNGELMRNFLKNNANQLTIYGLFCLQDGLKERELCVFFRNNHFSTMFKFDGELYLLATDQGYINQPDLVWEKLNEVNGDTVFMTGNFKEFKVENQDNTTWNEQNALASTADYLASIDNSAQVDSSFNSDLQLAIALQQQEFEQQPQSQSQSQPQPQHSMQQPTVSGGSRLVTGPQVSRNSSRTQTSSSRQDAKSKEKCIVM